MKYNPKQIIMKKLFILLIVAFALYSCGNGNYKNNGESAPQQIEQAAAIPMENLSDAILFKHEGTAKDVFPKDCDTICYLQGYLNDDDFLDLVLVATPRNPENMMTRSDGYEYNFNEPVLAIYFGKDDETYTLFKEYPNTIPGAVDEFTFVTVDSYITEEGVLRFGVEFFSSAGGSETDQNDYFFYFQDDDFYLIGTEKDGFSRYSGEGKKVSCNYLTKKQLTTTRNVFDETVKPTETWTDLPDEPLERLGARLLD